MRETKAAFVRHNLYPVCLLTSTLLSKRVLSYLSSKAVKEENGNADIMQLQSQLEECSWFN